MRCYRLIKLKDWRYKMKIRNLCFTPSFGSIAQPSEYIADCWINSKVAIRPFLGSQVDHLYNSSQNVRIVIVTDLLFYFRFSLRRIFTLPYLCFSPFLPVVVLLYKKESCQATAQCKKVKKTCLSFKLWKHVSWHHGR